MKKKAFSLIELMVVVAIISILAAVAIPAYSKYVVKARISNITHEIDILNQKIIMYYNRHSSFPTTFAQFGYTTDGSGNAFANVNTVSPLTFDGIAFMGMINQYPPNPSCAKILYASYAFAIPTDAYAVNGNYLSSLEYFLQEQNGVVRSNCFYTYSDFQDVHPTNDLGFNGCLNKYGNGAAAYSTLNTDFQSIPAGCL